MQKVLCIFLLLLSFTGISRAAVSAASDTIASKTKEQTLYMFAVSQNLSDSLVYISDISSITADNLVQKGFFTDRDLYADQFRLFIEKSYATLHQTAVVYFDVKPAALERVRQKLRSKLNGQIVGLSKLQVKDIYKDRFVFKRITVSGN